MSRDNHCPVVLVAVFFFGLFVVDYFWSHVRVKATRKNVKMSGS